MFIEIISTLNDHWMQYKYCAFKEALTSVWLTLNGAAVQTKVNNTNIISDMMYICI